MRSKIAVAVIVAALTLCLSRYRADGQSVRRDAITFGAVELVLGLNQESAIAALAPNYNIVNVGGSGYLWIIQSKPGSPSKIYGSLRFERGTLVVIQKNWEPDDQQKGFDLARNLYLALGQLPKDTLSSCKIELNRSEETTHESMYIDIFCGGKHILLSAARIVEGPLAPVVATTLDEVLK